MYHQIMAKKGTNPKSSMQREWYCLAVHKNIRKCTFEYTGAEKQIAKKDRFRHLLLLSAPFRPFVCKILHFFNGMGLRLGNGISPCFFTFVRGGVWWAIAKLFLFFGENFLLLVYMLRIPLVTTSHSYIYYLLWPSCLNPTKWSEPTCCFKGKAFPPSTFGD